MDIPIDIASISSDFFSKYKNSPSSLSKQRIKTYIINKILKFKEINRSNHGNTILHCAVSNPNCTPKEVLELLQQESNVNEKNKVGDTPLNFAVYYNCNLDVLKILLEGGADIHACNNFGDTALHRALDRPVINTEVVEVLLQHGADVNKTNFRSEAALHYCLRKADMRLIRLLLDHGANYGVVNKNMDTLLHLALDIKFNLELINLLIDSGIPINCQNAQGDTPLQITLSNQISTTNSQLDIIRLLLSNGADCNLPNKAGIYPLHTALKNITCTTDVIQMLLHNGASVDILFKDKSILHIACISFHCNVDTIGLLLDYRADIEASDSNMETPLFSAVRGLNCQSDVIKVLLKRGANINTLNKNIDSVLHVAIKSKRDIEIVNLLLDNGADVYEGNLYGRPALLVALTIPNVNIAIVQLLMSKTENWINKTDSDFNSPLHLALRNPQCPMEVIKLLLENKLSLNAKNCRDETPMHYAVHIGDFKVIRYALANRGQVTLRDGYSKYPLEYAIEKYNKQGDNNYRRIIQLLIKFSFLEGKQQYFKVRGLINKCWASSMMIKFCNDCFKEVEQMDSEYVTEGLTLSGLISNRSKPLDAMWKNVNWDIKPLLEIMAENKYCIYNEVIADAIQRDAVVEKVNKILIYRVSEDTNVKSVLNHHCISHLITFLSDGELLNLLLAYHTTCPNLSPKAIPSKRSKCQSKNILHKKQKY